MVTVLHISDFCLAVFGSTNEAKIMRSRTGTILVSASGTSRKQQPLSHKPVNSSQNITIQFEQFGVMTPLPFWSEVPSEAEEYNINGQAAQIPPGNLSRLRQ
jgi:hypothetical protein